MLERVEEIVDPEPSAQAALPAKKTEWWSRPLVALLFFLQPIVRGWARYRGRLAVRPLTVASQATLDSVALRNSRQPLDEVSYWAQDRLDRLAFVAAILRRLDQKGWPNRSDAGWSEHDVEIYGSRWTHLRITTVSEDHPQNRQMVRCRLRTMWSLAAQILFCSLLGFELLVLALLLCCAACERQEPRADGGVADACGKLRHQQEREQRGQ